jgi:hypothetical protein
MLNNRSANGQTLRRDGDLTSKWTVRLLSPFGLAAPYPLIQYFQAIVLISRNLYLGLAGAKNTSKKA